MQLGDLRATALAAGLAVLIPAAGTRAASLPGPLAGAPVGVASQPSQPTSGVGSDGACTQSQVTLDNATYPGNPVYVFTPHGPGRAAVGGRCDDKKRPVIVLGHGLGNSDPASYEGLITHLVSRGNAVVEATYQLTSGDLAAALTAYATVDAGTVQGVRSDPRLDTGRVGFWGHSFGASMIPYLLQHAAARHWGRRSLWMTSVAMTFALGVGPDLLAVPRNTRAMTIGMEDDEDADNRIGDEVFEALDLPGRQKHHIQINSDPHGQPAIVAEHTAPSGGNGLGVDAVDHLLWRYQDILETCSLTGRLCHADLSYAGTWSDGTPVVPSLISPHPIDVGPYPAALAECDGAYGQMLNQARIHRCGATHL